LWEKEEEEEEEEEEGELEGEEKDDRRGGQAEKGWWREGEAGARAHAKVSGN